MTRQGVHYDRHTIDMTMGTGGFIGRGSEYWGLGFVGMVREGTSRQGHVGQFTGFIVVVTDSLFLCSRRTGDCGVLSVRLVTEVDI